MNEKIQRLAVELENALSEQVGAVEAQLKTMPESDKKRQLKDLFEHAKTGNLSPSDALKALKKINNAD